MEHHILHDLHDLSPEDIQSPVRTRVHHLDKMQNSSRARLVLLALAFGILGVLVFRR